MNPKSKIENPKPKIAAPLLPIELAQLRQALYRLFGALFLYPDENRIERLRAAAGELHEEAIPWETFPFHASLQRLLSVLSRGSAETTGKLEEEYVRLFQAKSATPPYESFYLDPNGQTRAWIATQIEQEYATAGLILSPSLMDLPDHIAVELEFMSFLCAGEVRTREAAAEADNIQVRTRQRAFMSQHLAKWFPQFARRIEEVAPESFYSLVVEATYAFLRYDLGFLGLRQNDAGP